MDRQDFLKLPSDEVENLVLRRGKPKVGVFIPDGNRRLVLARTNLKENGEEFLREVAITQTSGFMDNLKVFFSHGLPALFSPLFSKSVLQRSESYRQMTILETLRILFTEEAWLEFFDSWHIHVKVYGNLDALDGVCLPAIAWAKELEQRTKAHDEHWLCLGIGGEPYIGNDVLVGAFNYFYCFGVEPSREQLIEFLYNRFFQPADFVIVSSKCGGVGAFPGLICGRNTKMYYLPVPGVMGLTQYTYRQILYDILFAHGEAARQKGYELTPVARHDLRVWYDAHLDTVIGTGRSLETVWLPVLEGEE